MLVGRNRGQASRPLRLGGQVAEGAQTQRVVPEGVDHHLHVFRGAEMVVLALQDGSDDLPGLGGRLRLMTAQVVGH